MSVVAKVTVEYNNGAIHKFDCKEFKLKMDQPITLPDNNNLSKYVCGDKLKRRRKPLGLPGG